MSLFERIKNIRRSNLQEKKIKFPGGTGDIGFTAPKRGEKVQKRLDRADKLGTPDPFDPDYDKKVKKVDKRTKIGKKVSSAFETPKKSDLKKLDKQPGGYRAPASAFGKGDTKGQMNVKDMQRRAFVKTPAVEYDPKTAPTGIKIPGKTYKTFRKASKGTRNISSMNPSEMQRAFGTSSTEGGAGASGSSKTVAKDYTKKINQANKNRKEFTGNKKTFSAFKKQADAATNKLVSKREVVRSTTDTKDVKKLRDINKQIKASQRISKGYDLASKGKGLPNAPVVASDLKTVTDNTAKVTFNPSEPPEGKALTGRKINKKVKSKVSPTTEYRRTVSKKYGIKPKNILSKTQKSILKQKRLAQRDVVKAAIGPQNRAFFKKAIALPGAKKAAPVIKALAKAGPVGRVAAVVGTVSALSPAARKGLSSFAKRALTGAGLGGVIGGAAASQKETDKKRIKNMKKPVFVKGSKKVEKGLNLNLSDISKPKDKPRTSQSIATEVDYLKKRQKVAPYGAKYTG